MPKTWHVILGGGLVSLAGVLIASIQDMDQRSSKTRLSFVTKCTNLPLDQFVAERVDSTETDVAVLVAMVLTPPAVEKVLRTTLFHEAHHPRGSGSTGWPVHPSEFMMTRELSAGFRTLRHDAQLFHAGVCAQGNPWGALLDHTTGALWVEVMQPDLGGDQPPCRFVERAESTQ